MAQVLENPSSQMIKTHLSCKVKTMVPDVLVPQGARASAAMVLSKFFQNIPVAALDGLIIKETFADIRVSFLKK